MQRETVENFMRENSSVSPKIITAGSNYLDIDAYACCVALKELFDLKGPEAITYSFGVCNYSICQSLIKEREIADSLPEGLSEETAEYIIVDVSDPHYLGKNLPIDNVIEVYDHHSGFEEYWEKRIGDKSHIEFLGAAVTLIYREWKKAGIEDKISRDAGCLMIAAILDNTLNLTSSNTTDEDIEVFNELCKKFSIDEKWCAEYFLEVQKNIEADLKNALFNDIKTNFSDKVLPSKIAQLCIWDAKTVLEKLPMIRQWLDSSMEDWMINIIDIKHHCSYFVCDDAYRQKQIEEIFGIDFESGIARLSSPYLRKEIIKTIKAHYSS